MRLRFVRWMVVGGWGLGVVAACSSSSSDDGSNDTTYTPPPKKDSGAKDSAPADPDGGMTVDDGGDPPDTSVAMPETYQGKLASTAKVSFGGSPYCTYEVMFTNLEAQLVLTGAGGDVKGMTLKGRMVESTVQPCSQSPIAANDHTYTLTGAKASSGAGFHVDLGPGAANMPKATGAVELTKTATGFSAAIELHRNDLGPPFDWRVKAVVPITLVK